LHYVSNQSFDFQADNATISCILLINYYIQRVSIKTSPTLLAVTRESIVGFL